MFEITISHDVSAYRAKLDTLSSLIGADRTAMNRRIADNVETVTKVYLNAGAGTIHKTATELEAKRTNFYQEQANFIKVDASASGMVMTMPRAGLSRAFVDYHLFPTGGRKLITIPVKAEAYGKMARSFPGLVWRRFNREDVMEGRSDTSGLVLGSKDIATKSSIFKGRKKGLGTHRKKALVEGMFVALYRGVRQAHIKQDRFILPPDENWLDAAEAGVNTYLAGIFG